MRQSQPLEQERYQVDKNSIVNFFQKLQNLRFEEISPKLVINIDETGIGSSKSGRMKSKRVLVTKETNETIFHSELTPSHKVSVITGITANGKVLKSAVISKRKYEDEYGSNCPYFYKDFTF